MKLINLISLMVVLSLAMVVESVGIGFPGNQFPGQFDDNNTPGGDYLSFSFPWYSPDISFSGPEFNISSELDASQELSSAFSFFSGFYATSGMPVISGIISMPTKFEISHKEPAKIYFGSGEEVEYSKYASTATSRNNELWIQGTSKGAVDWSEFVMCPQGSWLQLVAYAPVGGSAGFYEIIQNETQSLSYKVYQFYPGYNAMSFSADQVGRHVLLFIVNNQPSNAVIVDVFAPAAASMPPSEGSVQQYPLVSNVPDTISNTPVPTLTSGDTPVTIKSSGMRGYDVYVDGIYIGKENSGVGSFSFDVVGNMYHDIRVYDGQFNYPKRIYFERGVTKIINVEPGAALYI